MKILISLIILKLFVLCSCIRVRNVEKKDFAFYRRAKTSLSIPDGFSVVTWNIGYAGLGKDSDFIADGGKGLLPPPQARIEENTRNILRFLQDNPADLFIFQEMADYSLINRSVNLLREISAKLESYHVLFSKTTKLQFFNQKFIVGNSIFTRFLPYRTERHELPSEKKFFLGIKQKHHILVCRFPIDGSDKEWVIINLHLSAFDEEAKIRRLQLKFIKDVMQTEYVNGNYVVLGGDWNVRLANTDFPYTTKEKYLFWIHDLPDDFTPEGWAWGIDPSSPTVRTLERSYRKNENYTCVIDGFLTSPNVEIIKAKTVNLDFQNSDHNPVYLKVKRKE